MTSSAPWSRGPSYKLRSQRLKLARFEHIKLNAIPDDDHYAYLFDYAT
jgi:hypothetical protein